ncbi:hypothetical protein [Silvanigrella aquatica]|uniref:Uncharacterized protein n=1 Tax=Silvanigrella aquatica TaxID=1915309 RepID=A0A1L4D3B8_9BACT|nr:hypothetical protein [Silvanigrella aquatica]APJ04698.1 hypothetical protein AXG55_12615 [Silvanigrella aquatica]
MKKLNILKKYLILILLNGTNFSAYSSDYTYIFCADRKSNWHWLLDDQDNYIKIEGKWNYYCYNGIHFSYFIPNDSFNQIKRLSRKCIEKFGLSYETPQPAINFGNRWSIFALNKNLFYQGRLSVRYQEYNLNYTKIIKLYNDTYNLETYNNSIEYNFIGLGNLYNSIINNIKIIGGINENENEN